MGKFSDFNTAARTKGAVEAIAAEVVKRIYPLPRFASVTAIDTANRKVTVQYPDEAGTFTIPCLTVMPRNTGSTVRVNGPLGARHVDEVLDGHVRVGDLTAARVYAGGQSGDAVFIGDDAVLADMNIPNFINLKGQQDPTTGFLHFGSSGPTIGKSNTGGLRVSSPHESALQLYADNNRPYFSWFGGTDGARRGYLGYPDTTNNTSYLVFEGPGRIDSTTGSLYFYTGANERLALTSGGDIYTSGNTHYFRDASFVERMKLNSSGLYLSATNTWFRTFGNGGWYSETHGGGLHMTDSTWVRVYNGKSLSIDGSGAIVSIDSGTLVAGAPGTRPTSNVRGYFKRDVATANASWDNYQVVIENSESTAFCGIALHAYNVAPTIKAYHGAEAVEFQNNANSGFVPISASAFNVNSTLRAKIDVVQVSDVEILSRAKQVRPIRFRQAVRPQTLRKSARFADIDARWQEGGHSPLYPTGEHLESHDHDCAVDECSGTAEAPCAMTLNDHDKIGLAAEEVYEVMPEAVWLDLEGKPQAIDLSQIASAAFTGVGALVRLVEQLTLRVAALENPLAQSGAADAPR